MRKTNHIKNETMTSETFIDNLFNSALNKYQEDWHDISYNDIGKWLNDNVDTLADSDWVHALFSNNEVVFKNILGGNYEKKFYECIHILIKSYIENGKLENYIYNQMKDYASDLEYHKNIDKSLGYPT